MSAVILTRRDGTTLPLEPLGTNALCLLEEQTGLTFGELLTALGVNGLDRWSLRTTRIVLQACAPPGTTIEAIGALIDEVGFDALGAAVNQLIAPAQARGQ